MKFARALAALAAALTFVAANAAVITVSNVQYAANAVDFCGPTGICQSPGTEVRLDDIVLQPGTVEFTSFGRNSTGLNFLDHLVLADLRYVFQAGQLATATLTSASGSYQGNTFGAAINGNEVVVHGVGVDAITTPDFWQLTGLFSGAVEVYIQAPVVDGQPLDGNSIPLPYQYKHDPSFTGGGGGTVPEPTSYALVALALFGLAYTRRQTSRPQLARA